MVKKPKAPTKKKLPSFLTKRKSIVIGLVAVLGVTTLIFTQAATSFSISIEPETGTPSGSITPLNDATASNGKYIKFGTATTPPPPTGGQPTKANTGPRYALTNISPDQFYNTRTCNKQRITSDIRFDQSWMKGQTFNLTDCEVPRIWLGFGNLTPLPQNELPIINMDYVDVPNSIITGSAAKFTINHSWMDNGASQFKLTDNWLSPSAAPYPLKVYNSVFRANYITQPAHSEALQTSDDGKASGMQFANTVFMVQAGSMDNTGITATVNFHVNDTVFDGCYFIWDGAPPVPAWYSAQIIGSNNTIKNSWFEKGHGGYVTTEGTHINMQNNKDIQTGQPVN